MSHLYVDLGGSIALRAMPLLLGVLCVLAIAYRYYSAFLAAKVAVLDAHAVTPAHRLDDGSNYHPTSKWVLWGHHFAAISGAGPLIGPVLAVQYGYLPGLLWLVIGVCLAGAVQDMLVLALSVRRDGKSLAHIARAELGPFASGVVSAAILFIVVIALAGLGFVVVKALGGEEVKLAGGTEVEMPLDGVVKELGDDGDWTLWEFPAGSTLRMGDSSAVRPESFVVAMKGTGPVVLFNGLRGRTTIPAGSVQRIAGSSWGTFTIACTIPIALFVGWYMYCFRKGRTVEASIIGGLLTLGATVAGAWVPGSAIEPFFSLTRAQTTAAICTYGFVASVLPVWLLLAPRDYLSSFLKVGTIALLIGGVLVANPVLPCPLVNPVFRDGGPTFPGAIFPFVFICVMCGSISGFHALVSSGTTPKMVSNEAHIRPIGYGAMLMEGVVGVVALVAAASLEPKLYYDINVNPDVLVSEKPADVALRGKLDRMLTEFGPGDLTHLPVERRDLGKVEELVGGEALRGRTGGAVTLAVGMSFILTDALAKFALDPAQSQGLVKYWYHFAIMFEALFILTTIDAGTRIARFLVQEAMGKVSPKLGRTDWWPGAWFATGVVTLGWGGLVIGGSIDTIWPMFGIANQLLAVLALALVTTALVNRGRGRYAFVTLVPMLFVVTTTMTAGVQMVGGRFWLLASSAVWEEQVKGTLCIVMTVFVMVSVGTLLLQAASRWVAVLMGVVPAKEST